MLLICLSLFISSDGFASSVNQQIDIEKIDPGSLSEKQYYQYEYELISGYSGSGGYFLNEPQIAWLRKAEKSFQSRGIKLKDEWNRHSVIAWSYFNNEIYDKALREFEAIKDQGGIELAEWKIDNKGIKNGVVKVKEYPGKLPFENSQEAKVADKRYLFVAYFKGPVCRYDKIKNVNAIIYSPDNEYDWCDKLSLVKNKLTIKLRDVGKVGDSFAFDNISNKIHQVSGKGANKEILRINSVYIAMNKPGDQFGRLFVTKDRMVWGNGPIVKYKVIKKTKDFCLVEFTSKKLPEFYSHKCRYGKFTINEPDEEVYAIGLEVVPAMDDFKKKYNDWFSYALVNDND